MGHASSPHEVNAGTFESKTLILRCYGTIGVPLVLSAHQQQEVLHLHHTVMGTVVRHY